MKTNCGEDMGMCCDRGFVEIHHVTLIDTIVVTLQRSKLVLHSNAMEIE